MSETDSIHHTNDVPITSIKDRSAALWGLLTRSLPMEDCLLIDTLFLKAVELKANDELIHRQPGVTFNARLARIIQIAADALPLSTSLAIKCLIACCSDPERFISEICRTLPNSADYKFTSNAESDFELLLAKCCSKLDEIRHLHLSNLSTTNIKLILEESDYLNNKLSLESNNKFKTQFTAAITNTKLRLLDR